MYYVYRNYPLVEIHPGAMLAATFAECAADQGHFWPLHERLFAGHIASEWGSGGAKDRAKFLDYAKEVQLDVEQLQRCLDEEKTVANRIQSDIDGAAGYYIRSTPTFLLNGEVLHGTYSYRVWKSMLDDRLAKVEK